MTPDLEAFKMLETAIFPDAWSEKTLLEALRTSNYLILLRRDAAQTPLAYLIGVLVGDEAELLRLGVVFEARGQGIGGDLVEEALGIWRSRGAARVFLEVRESNGTARRLYAARGFELVGKRANYYENGETALVLRRDLSE